MINRYEKFSTYIASAYRYVQKLEREEMEKQLREKLRAEILESMAKEKAAQSDDNADK